MKIKNLHYRNVEMNTSRGKFKLDDHGCADVSDEVGAFLLTCGYVAVDVEKGTSKTPEVVEADPIKVVAPVETKKEEPKPEPVKPAPAQVQQFKKKVK